MEPSATVERLIREKVEKLDQFYDRIANCQIVVEALTLHARKHYRVHIDLKVPRAEIVVNRDPPISDEHNDLAIALRDSFDAARRQLEDYARQQRGEVKSHENAHAPL